MLPAVLVRIPASDLACRIPTVWTACTVRTVRMAMIWCLVSLGRGGLQALNALPPSLPLLHSSGPTHSVQVHTYVLGVC
ncbi:hypothetical protein LZ30DRAFT_700360 [Colletotrichum cereale]|nr:hypothetical protein LZ30DRAFT_700360 [Colletotrichum cereale]